MIEVENMSFRYPEGEPVLRDISFVIGEREKVVLLGANGSGKTTLLQILDALVFPQAGAYRYRGEPVTERQLKNKNWGRRFRREVVLLFQHPEAMLFNPTVYDEIAYGLRQLAVEDLDVRVREYAARLGVERCLERLPFQLSGGEKQKVCMASLLALEPEVLLLDEPTANLDARSAGWLIDFLRDLPVTTVATTHNPSVAMELGTRALVLSEEHRVIFDGAMDQLMGDGEKLLAANLVHVHQHRHGVLQHRHIHGHE